MSLNSCRWWGTPFAIKPAKGEADGEVSGGQDIRSAKRKDEQHVNGPGADPADRGKTLEKLVVRHSKGRGQSGDLTYPAFEGEVAQGGELGAGQTGGL